MAETKYESTGTSTTTPTDDVGLIERAFLMGVGAAMMARDRVQELADDLVSRGKLSRDEAGGFVNRMYSQADEVNASVRETVARETERAMQNMGLATKRDITEIHDELTEIRTLLAQQRPMGFTDVDESTTGL